MMSLSIQVADHLKHQINNCQAGIYSNTLRVYFSLPGVPGGHGLHFWECFIAYISTGKLNNHAQLKYLKSCQIVFKPRSGLVIYRLELCWSIANCPINLTRPFFGKAWSRSDWSLGGWYPDQTIRPETIPPPGPAIWHHLSGSRQSWLWPCIQKHTVTSWCLGSAKCMAQKNLCTLNGRHIYLQWA